MSHWFTVHYCRLEDGVQSPGYCPQEDPLAEPLTGYSNTLIVLLYLGIQCVDPMAL